MTTLRMTVLGSGSVGLAIAATFAHAGLDVPPCGRCRELIRQVADANSRTRIIVARGRVAFLSELLPFQWKADSVSHDD
jgi:cytidine deaminase